LLAALDSLGLPVVGGVDALLIAVSTVEPQHAYLGATCAIIGSVIGSYILFAIARKGGHVMLAKQTSQGAGLRLRNWFERYGLLTVFIPALSPIPMPMKIPVFCAGALEVRARSFVAVVALARCIRYFTLAYLGQRYGRDTLAFVLSHWPAVVIAVVALCVVAIVLLRVMNRKQPEIPEGVAATGSE
jgi:membrane protein YqaA with SNARE-associated domain